LLARSGGKRTHTGKVATGTGKVGHETTSDRISSERHDNRYLARRALGRTDGSFAAGHDYVDGKFNQFARIGREVV
jgi:hypothetical protein